MKERYRESQDTLASEMTEEELSGLRVCVGQIPQGGRVLEVGTAAGGTLVEIAKCMGVVSRGQISVVDPFSYFPNQLEKWKENLLRNGVNPEFVTVFQAKSAEALTQAVPKSDEMYSFLLIDASHKLKHVIMDTRWLSRLEVGGVAAFHDYCDAFPGVQRAVDVFLARNENYKILKRSGSLLFIKKSEASKGVEVSNWIILKLTIESLLADWRRSILKRLKRRE